MGGDQGDSPSESLSKDAVLELLSHHRHRRLLSCLRTHDGALPLPDLADEIATREHDATIDEVPADEVKRIYMSLYHRHIPKLEDYGVVQYNQERDMVVLVDGAEQLLAGLEMTDR